MSPIGVAVRRWAAGTEPSSFLASLCLVILVMPIISQAGTTSKITFGVFKGSPPPSCPPSHLVLQIHYRLLPPMSPTIGPYVPPAKIIFHQSATNGRRVRPTLPSAISWAWVLPVGWAPSPLAETCPAREQSAPPPPCPHSAGTFSNAAEWLTRVNVRGRKWFLVPARGHSR